MDRRGTPQGLGSSSGPRRYSRLPQAPAARDASECFALALRARRKGGDAHDRQIITDAPNIMWAIDATQITTVQDGKVWLFGVAEHWNAELLGWHVAKRGTRFEALQAVGMAVRNQFDRVDADGEFMTPTAG